MPLTINTVGSITNRQKSKTCSKRLSSLLQIRNMINALARWHRRGIKLSAILLAVAGLVVLPAIAGVPLGLLDANPPGTVQFYRVYGGSDTNSITNLVMTVNYPWGRQDFTNSFIGHYYLQVAPVASFDAPIEGVRGPVFHMYGPVPVTVYVIGTTNFLSLGPVK